MVVRLPDNNRKIHLKKQSWPILKCSLGVYLGKTRINAKSCQDGQFADRYSISEIPKHEEAVTIGQIFHMSILCIKPLAPNDIHMSYRTANLQTLHFKYLLNKYTY